MTEQYKIVPTPGLCPVCNTPAVIWEAVSQNWECPSCSWRGRDTKRLQNPENVGTHELQELQYKGDNCLK